MKLSKLILTCWLYLIAAAVNAADFPSSPDWQPLSDISTYRPDNLWEYINGAADQFIDYGMQICSVGEFKSGDVSFSIDIYDMDQPINAYGVYATESRGIETRLHLGSEAAISLPSQCLMFKDRYYIKVYVFEGQLTKPVAESILSAISDGLPGKNNIPAVLDLLPASGRIAGSEGFTRIGYLGLSDLRNCLFASYTDQSGETYQYFFMLLSAGEDAAQIFAALAPAWKAEEWDGPPLKIRKIPYQGFAGIMLSEKGLTGVSNAASSELIRQRLSVLLKP
jgi:hypothetical protein